MKPLFPRVLVCLLALLMMLPLAACGGSSASDGFVFQTPDGVELAIGASGTDAIEALGKALSVVENPTCYNGDVGTEYIYTYEHFRISAVTTADYDVLLSVELLDDALKTPEGLYIGMSAEDAKAAMSGKGEMKSAGDSFSYIKGNTKLQISVREGAVSGIRYLEVQS